jgi:hypothetical protein
VDFLPVVCYTRFRILKTGRAENGASMRRAVDGLASQFQVTIIMMLSPRQSPRHRCLLHDGASPRQLSAVATVMRDKLEENHRCIYFDSPSRIAELRPSLESAGIRTEREVMERRLLLCCNQQHLPGGEFYPERMIRSLEIALEQAVDDGYDGLWASGDVAWEMGPQMDCSTLWDYERRLEMFIRENAEFSGICQYHVGILGRRAVRQGLLTHQSIFVSENLSMINPYFLECGSSYDGAAHPLLLDAAIGRLCEI